MPVQPGAVEQTSKRTSNAKHFKNPDGSFSASISGGSIHYQANAGGAWLDKKPSFRSGPGTAEWISDASDVTMRTFQVGTGGNAKWWVEFKETLTGKGIQFNVPFQPTVVANDNKLTFSDGAGGTWAYYHTRVGGKMLGPSTLTSKGAQSFSIPFALIGGADPLALDASGSIVCGTIFKMPRSYLMGADGRQYAASAWSISGTTLTFTYDDSTLPIGAYPYQVDPSSTFNIAAGANDQHVFRSGGGSYPPTNAITWDSTATKVVPERMFISAGNYELVNGLLRWDTSSLPDGSTVTSATMRVDLVVVLNTDGLSLLGEWYTWDGVSATDYTPTPSSSAHTGTAISTLSTSQTNVDFALTAFDANVSRTGMTSMRWHVSQRAADAAPTGGNYAEFASFEHTTANEARLLVDYTIAASDVTAVMPGQHFGFHKASATAKAASTWQGLWTTTGYPAAGAFPTGAGAGALVTNATTGAIPYVNPSQSLSLARFLAAGATQGTLILYDRLWHAGGYSGTATTSQTVGSPALTRYATGTDVELWLEYSGATGATASTLTVTYTNQAGTGSRTTAVAHVNASVAGQMVPVPVAAGDTGIRAVASVQASSTTGVGTGAVLGLVLMRRIAELPLAWGGTQNQAIKTYIPLGMPSVQAGAALSFVVQTSTTSTGLILGSLDLAAV